jgi:hypothetical protein
MRGGQEEKRGEEPLSPEVEVAHLLQEDTCPRVIPFLLSKLSQERIGCQMKLNGGSILSLFCSLSCLSSAFESRE